MEKQLKQQVSSCIKIVLFGPESTGKTTLAKQLAAHYKTAYVPEYARQYAAQKHAKGERLTKADVLPIAIGQMQLENQTIQQTKNLLICDTNLLVTQVYAKVYYSYANPILKKYAIQNHYHIYFLTYIDTPWKPDGVRDKPNERDVIFQEFKNALVQHNKPYVLLKGNQEIRFQTAIRHIDKLLNNKVNFTKKDLQQITNKGLHVDSVNNQIDLFKTGVPFLNLKAAANIGNGILQLSEAQKNKSIALFESYRNQITIIKFVPASGAATRMFKFLFQFLKDYNVETESINAYINRNKATELSLFLIGLEKLPFYKIVLEKTKSRIANFSSLPENNQKLEFIKTMLQENQLNYGFYPKGLLPFHQYKDHVSTAFEEHLFEAALYASANQQANLHFTISEKHKHIFDAEFKRIQKIVETKTKTKFHISFSYQCQSTDTIAVTPKNEPFREDNGDLLFRPSGHGALLSNLNNLDADIIFIKNIDNVVVFKYENEVAQYKKMLAGILLKLQQQAFAYLEEIEKNQLSQATITQITAFLKNKMQVVISNDFEKFAVAYQIKYLKEKLNRPIRVCGMVKNEGEPGGGPFWVKDESGNISLQIVESAQIDKKNKSQKEILKNATHFNPVDLVCGIKNYKGEKFNLNNYVDPKTAFITMKTKTGKDLKALEIPGLWNGAMAHWNTIFVEVPLITFNPVKTVTDLLKATHQIKE